MHGVKNKNEKRYRNKKFKYNKWNNNNTYSKQKSSNIKNNIKQRIKRLINKVLKLRIKLIKKNNK